MRSYLKLHHVINIHHCLTIFHFNLQSYFVPHIAFGYFRFASKDYLTEHGIAQANVDRLGLLWEGLAWFEESVYVVEISVNTDRVVGKCVLAELAADTRLLVTTEWQLVVQGVIGVDPDGSGLEGVRHLNSGVEVRGVNGGSKTVGGRIASLDDLLLGLELGDGADRAEDFLPNNLHVLGDVGEDGRLDEVALVTLAVATDLDGSTTLLALLDVAIESKVRLNT